MGARIPNMVRPTLLTPPRPAMHFSPPPPAPSPWPRAAACPQCLGTLGYDSKGHCCGCGAGRPAPRPPRIVQHVSRGRDSYGYVLETVRLDK